MSKHTPGPWVVNGAGVDFRELVRFPSGVIVSCKSKKGYDIETARLIAAAPDMYEALKVALGFVAAFAGYYQVAYETGSDYHPKHKEAIAQVRAALAKADGRG